MKYFKFLFLLSNLIIVLGFYAETKEKVEKENELFESNKLGKTNHLISSIKWEIIDRNNYYLDNQYSGNLFLKTTIQKKNK